MLIMVGYFGETVMDKKSHHSLWNNQQTNNFLTITDTFSGFKTLFYM